jgi:hypothetical protein
MRILSLFAVALASCYDPPIADCQFTCPDNKCPGDQACMAGICRTPGVSGKCPCPDPPTGCTLMSNSAGECLAACNTARIWDDARTACAATGQWHLAVLDTAETLSAGENALRSSTTWIGLHRSSVLDLAWTWITGGASISATAADWASGTGHGGAATFTCAATDGGKLYSDDCGTAHPSACTPN